MKRKFGVLLLLFIVNVTLISCDRISDNYWERIEQKNYVSPYKGTYFGRFSGSANGTLNMEINKSGNVTIQREINNTNQSETFYGNINNYGAFQNTNSQHTGFTIYGNLNSQNNLFNGTWKLNSD